MARDKETSINPAVFNNVAFIKIASDPHFKCSATTSNQ